MKEKDWCSIAGCINAGCSIAGVALLLLYIIYPGRENISFVAVRNGLNHMLSSMSNSMINLQGERE